MYIICKGQGFSVTEIAVKDAARLAYTYMIYDLLSPTFQDAIMFSHFGLFDLNKALNDTMRIIYNAFKVAKNLFLVKIHNRNDLDRLANIIISDII